jgi:TonB family protein
VWTLLLAWTFGFAAPQTVHEAGEPGLEPPRLIPESRVEPAYPEDALRDGIQGTVVLRVVVDADGRVSVVEVFRSPYNGEALALAAAAAVGLWRYRPASLDGRPVACRIMQTVAFHPPVGGNKERKGRPPRGRRKQPPNQEAAPPEPTPEKPGAVKAEEPPAVTTQPELSPAPRKNEKPAVVPLAPPQARPEQPAPEAPADERPPEVPSPRPPQDEAAAPERTTPAEPPSPPAPPEDASSIDVAVGGPGGLLLGQPGQRARELLSGASRGDGPPSTEVWHWPEQGMEVTLVSTPQGERVGAIRYFFLDQPGRPATRYRTRKGLGRGSFCLGVVPAYGRPEQREEATDGDGSSLLSLEYHRSGTGVRFLCRDGRLAELLLTGE